MDGHRDDLLGPVAPRGRDGFPLLVKYLDARQNLSIQVHPSTEYAARYPQARTKSEAWYVIHAEPGAVLYKGLVEGAGPADLERAIRDGTVDELMVQVPARPRDVHYLPSGTCHALGAGVLVAEVETPSDTTFRVFDWGRTDRELHVEAALECIDFEPLDASPFEPGERTVFERVAVRALVRCPHFAIEEREAEPGCRWEAPGHELEVWMVTKGRLEIGSRSGAFDAEVVGPGCTVLLPASLSDLSVDVREPLLMLRVTLPVD
jgi:mannose-6-phosphate isomerase